MKFTIFESVYNKFMESLISEASLQYDLSDPDAKDIENSFGKGYDYEVQRASIDYSKEPLASDYSLFNAKHASIDPYELPIYCKPEFDTKMGFPKTKGAAAVYWLVNFNKICSKYEDKMGVEGIETTAKAAHYYRQTQVFGIMLNMLFSDYSEIYHPVPKKYMYYRIDTKALNTKIFNGKLKDDIEKDPETVAAKIDAVDDPEIVQEFSLDQIIRKSDALYTKKEANTVFGKIVLDKNISLTEEEYNKLQKVFSVERQSIINQCKAHNDGTPIHFSMTQYYENPSDYIAKRVGNADKPFAVGSNSDFKLDERPINCIKASDLIEAIRDYNQKNNPDYKPFTGFKNVNGLFRYSGSNKKYIFVYVWDEKHEVGKAKKLYIAG